MNMGRLNPVCGQLSFRSLDRDVPNSLKAYGHPERTIGEEVIRGEQRKWGVTSDSGEECDQVGLRKWWKRIKTRLEPIVEDMTTIKISAIKFKDGLNTNFTCSAETEAVPTIYVEETEQVPIYTDE